MATTVTLTANVPTNLADAIGLAAGAGRQSGAVLTTLSHNDAVTLVNQGLARFGSAADEADDSTMGVRPNFKGSAVLDFPSIAAAASAALTVAVPGAALGDPVIVGVPATLNAGLVPVGFVSAADTVTVRLTNVTAGAIDAASATWKVAVVNF